MEDAFRRRELASSCRELASSNRNSAPPTQRKLSGCFFCFCFGWLKLEFGRKNFKFGREDLFFLSVINYHERECFVFWSGNVFIPDEVRFQLFKRSSLGKTLEYVNMLKSRTVVSRDMSRSRDSLETLFFKVSMSSRSRRSKASVSSRSRHFEVSENGQVLAIFFIRALKSTIILSF